MGEGRTPLVDAPTIADLVRVGRVSLKLEWCNPTGSHKDRMSAQLVARAKDRGVSAIVAASSGNAGVSLAAYAARAGLRAEIIAIGSLPSTYALAIKAFGGRITMEADSLSRWQHMARHVSEGAFAATNYVLPAVGTNAFGVEGYKTLAAEIAAGSDMPDLIVLPTARGDLLSGLYLGFSELGLALPKLVAAEPFPRLARVLAGEDYRSLFDGTTAQFSIAGPTVTYQAVHALHRTGGVAIPVSDDAASTAAHQLARAGFYAELSAAAALAALHQIAADGKLKSRYALVVLTGAGFRDSATIRTDDQRGQSSPSRKDS